MSSKLNKLLKKRTVVKDDLSRFEAFLSEIETDSSKLNTLADRLNKFEETILDYERVQSEIEEVEVDDPATAQENYQDRKNFQDKYFDMLAKAKAKLQLPNETDRRSLNNNNSSIILQQNSSKNVRLPTISLPTFSGDTNCWSSFYDRFKSLIHDDANLTVSEKFFYLQSALSGDAAQLIQDLESTDVNYEIAWALLKERFEDTKNLIKIHIQFIFNIPILCKENYTDLRNFLDILQKNIRALKHLGEPVDRWDTLLLFILIDKLDRSTKREWETATNKMKSPSLSFFIEFLKERCSILKGITDNKVVFQDKNSSKIKKVQSYSSTEKTSKFCIFCNSYGHLIYYCDKFLRLDINTRIDKIKGIKACINCLKKGHTSSTCKSFLCKICNKHHNTLLHLKNSNKSSFDGNKSSTVIEKPNVTEESIPDQSEFVSMSSVTTNSFVFLSTALIDILDNKNEPIRCRALLDSGSQSCFITNELANRLKLPFEEVNISITGTNAVNAAKIQKSVKSIIKSVTSSFEVELPFLVLKNITENVPQYSISNIKMNIPKNITLADPTFNISSKIDILLGCNIFYDLLLNNKIKLNQGMPILQESHLGWIIGGPYNFKINNSLCLTSISKVDIQKQLEKFWIIEEILTKNKVVTEEEQFCETHFIESFYREFDGRFGVRLPFRKNINNLGESKEIALKRFINLEKKLNLNSHLNSEYSKFMDEYINLHHMSEVKTEDEESTNYFLPHHCVLKSDSLTTKVRVVFDGSCKTSSGISLNDVLMVGPKIQQDLFNILLRFRQNYIAFTADIEKMYRQINIHPDDRKYQRILWRGNAKENVISYELNTVTYGLGPSSFLATRCLKQLAIENEKEFPEASRIINCDFYMDDLISGCDNLESAKWLISQIVAILNSGKFPLRQWVSNDAKLLENLNIKLGSSPFLIKDTCNSKTLGVFWYPLEDFFGYSVNTPKFKNLTKRIVLSVISQIFDPLGLISPVIIIMKILLQKLWSLHLDWDDILPKNYSELFSNFYESIACINELKIPRLILINNYEFLELHCFSDASTSAYGTCIYLLSKNSNNDNLIRLLCSKSRVAPLKPITLPRLELSAALLAAQLYCKVKESLHLSFSKVVFWCDSTITLAWIKHDPSKLNIFVANRVTQINDLTVNCDWRYVPTNLNPADLVSRGIQPPKIINHSMWWKGPLFLLNEQNWPSPPSASISIPERKKIISCLSSNDLNDYSILDNYSSYSKLIRIVSFIFRFSYNSKVSENNRKYGVFTINEFERSKLAIIKLAQYRAFKSEINHLKRLRQIPTNSKLSSLSPFLDTDGILRVGGRICKAPFGYSKKHPIILSHDCNFTSLIIKYEHEVNLHAGVQTVLSNLRNTYWPIKGRQLVKKILRKCVKCFRARPQNLCQKMSDLPTARVTPSKPFHTVGVDYAGPYLIKDSKLRNRKYIKCYICIFVCFSSKAVHIELVSDLTAEGFLNALKRFISRRGLCRHIYSDNASYFTKADKELQSYFKFCQEDIVQNYVALNQVTWHFIPAYSPHMGGLWERTVKSVKHHLKRLLNDTYLTYEEFYTLLVQIEYILNSRPLLPLTEDPDDLEALTPGHLLLGSSPQMLPEPEVPDSTSITTSRYKHLQLMLQHFWKRWSLEYLNTLQQRHKWTTVCDNNIKPGVLVILKDKDIPPMKWKLGRVMAVHPGSDGMVRVLSIKTENGLTKRAVHNVCVLPIY